MIRFLVKFGVSARIWVIWLGACKQFQRSLAHMWPNHTLIRCIRRRRRRRPNIIITFAGCCWLLLSLASVAYTISLLHVHDDRIKAIAINESHQHRGFRRRYYIEQCGTPRHDDDDIHSNHSIELHRVSWLKCIMPLETRCTHCDRDCGCDCDWWVRRAIKSQGKMLCIRDCGHVCVTRVCACACDVCAWHPLNRWLHSPNKWSYIQTVAHSYYVLNVSTFPYSLLVSVAHVRCASYN